MADRYWVGGAGNWTATATANWSATSGGAGGASAPTSADNVIFNSASNATAYAVSVGANAVCADVTIAGPAVGNVTITIAATSVINCYGNWTNAATGVVFTTTSGSSVNFLATATGKTITTNNVSFVNTNIVLNGAGGGWTLGSAFTSTVGNSILVTQGSFSTGGFACTLNSFSSTGALTRSITLGASTITCSGTSPLNFSGTGLTFSAGTSTINCSGITLTFSGNGFTFNNVNFTSTSASVVIQGANTFANLSITSGSGARPSITFSANQTITGTFTPGASNSITNRMRLISDTNQTQRTLTVGTVATLADVDFRNIAVAGASAPWSGTRLGDGTGNSGITFPAPKTVYWSLAAGGGWGGASGWATSSGGTPASNNLPLAQDTAIIENTGLTAGNTITYDGTWWVGTITVTRTNAFTFTNNTNAFIYKDFTLTAVTTVSGIGVWYFTGIGVTQTITTAGLALTQDLNFDTVTGSVVLNDALTAARTASLISGTFNLVSYTFTCSLFSSTTTSTRVIAFGTGKIVVTGNNAGVINISSATGFSITGTPLIESTYSGSTGTRTIVLAAFSEANSISVSVTAGSDTVLLTTTSGAYRNINFTGFTGTIQFGNTTFCYGNFDVGGATAIAGTAPILFKATSGVKTVRTNNLLLLAGPSFDGVGGTWQLQSNFSVTTTVSTNLVNGTLDLNGYTLTTGFFSSSNSNARTLAFGAGKIVLSQVNATVWTTDTATNLAITGTSRVEISGAGTAGQLRSVNAGITGGTEANSFNFYVTAGADNVAFNGTGRKYGTIDFSNSGTSTFTGNFQSDNFQFTIYGNLVLTASVAGFTTSSSYSGPITFGATSGTKTVTSAGKTYPVPLTFNGVGGTWSLQDALTLGSTLTLTLTAGTLTTNGYAVTTGLFSSSNTNARALNLGASTVTITGTGTPWNIATSTNMTLNAGTSSLAFTGSTAAITFQGGGLTYYNVTYGATYFSTTIAGVNTFNNFTVASPVGVGLRGIPFANNQTINGTFTAVGAAANQRIVFFGAPGGSTITAAAVSLANDEFSDIIAAGASIPWTGTNLSNAGRNSNITFGAPRTVYWNQPTGGTWSDTAWATSSGGAVNINNFPLSQDIVIFNNVGVNASSTITINDAWNLGAWNAGSLTNALNINWNILNGGTAAFSGSTTLSSAVSFTPTLGNAAFGGFDGTITITSAGVSIPMLTTFYNPSQTFVLANNITFTGSQAVLSAGTLDLNGKTFTCVTFGVSQTTTRAIAFNGSQIYVTGNAATVWSGADLTNFSYTGTPTVNFTYSGSTGTRTTVNGSTGLTEANAVDFNIVSGSDAWATVGVPVGVRNFTVQPAFTGSTTFFAGGYIYGNVLLSPNQTVTSSISATTFAATSGTKTITTNGVTIDRPLTFNGVGGTWALQDALTLGATNGNLTLTNGTLSSGGFSVTARSFALGVGTKTLTMGASAWTISGNWNALTNVAGFTLSAGTSTISMNSATSKSFSGGSKTYYNLRQTGLGSISISGSNFFNSISNTVQPTTFSFEAGTTQTVNNFNVSGTAGNLVTLNSLTPSVRWNLAKNSGGKVLVSYDSITDSAATPAGYWFSPTSQGNVDGGNNTGWNFGAVGGAGGFLPFF